MSSRLTNSATLGSQESRAKGDSTYEPQACTTSPRSRLKDSRYLLSDFGISIQTSSGQSGYDIQEGDRIYMPEEVFRLSSSDTIASIDLTKVDVFSFGLLLLQLMTSIKLPDQGPEWNSLRSDGYASDLLSNTNYTQQLKDIVARCLRKDPSQRPSFSQILSETIMKKDFAEQIAARREEDRLARRLEILKESSLALLHEPASIDQRRLSANVDAITKTPAECSGLPVFSIEVREL